MSELFYLAYGSNLHPVRIGERIPSAQLIGTTSVPGFRLTFSKRGADQSGKGHIHDTDNKQSQIFAAIYKIGEEHKQTLDAIEGPGYASQSVAVRWKNRFINCFAYVGENSHLDESLKPFHWYKSLVILGAQFNQLPNDYIRTIQQVESVEDSDPERRRHNDTLISRISTYKYRP